MSYLKQVDTWLDKRLSEDGLLDERLYKLDKTKIVETKRAIKEKIQQSYQNGQRDCAKRSLAILDEFSRKARKYIAEFIAICQQNSKPRTNSKKYERRD